MAITVKDFANTLKISDKALIERMQKAGLSHKKNSDEVTASDKQALLKFLKGSKPSSSKSVTSESGVKVTSKGKSSPVSTTTKSYSDNIEAKRAAASEQLKEQQTKREEHMLFFVRFFSVLGAFFCPHAFDVLDSFDAFLGNFNAILIQFFQCAN